MLSSISFILLLIFSINCLQSNTQALQQLKKFTSQFNIQSTINERIQQSKNITFNSTREKYFYVYVPIFQICLQRIGQDFQPILDSITPSGIGAAGYGIAAGMKIGLKVGLWKMGLFGLIKTSAATLLSVSALPIVAGVGTLAYLYKSYEREQIKEKCRKSIQMIQNMINNEQYDFLIQIKKNNQQRLNELSRNLTIITQKQKSIKYYLEQYKLQTENIKLKEKMYAKYFKTFNELMSHK